MVVCRFLSFHLLGLVASDLLLLMNKDYLYFQKIIGSEGYQDLYDQVNLFDTTELFEQFVDMMNSEAIGMMLDPYYFPEDFYGELVTIADKFLYDLTTQDEKRIRLFMVRIVMEKRDGIKKSTHQT